jgi:glycerophosphoryl diester phosphodiesterase
MQRSEERIKRVGHGGASALVRGNTLESFDVALELGVDMIEFDVRACAGSLLLAHTRLDRYRRGCVSLEAALRHLAQPRFADVELNLDIKRPGCEAATLAVLRRHGLSERTLISSQMPAVLDRVRRLDASARVGVSVGGRLARSVARWGDWRERVLEALRAGRFGALMLHHPLVEAGLAERVRDSGAELYAWTAEDRATVQRLAGLAVTGITAADPRLFSPA